MPSWKKVILSGSDAALNTLSVSNSITASVISASQFTGSLFGTSSWAVSSSRAISASYVLTASYTQNAVSSSFATTASFGPNIGNTNLTLTGNRILTFGSNTLRFTHNGATTNFNNDGINISGSLTSQYAYIYGKTATPGEIYIYESQTNGNNSVQLVAPSSLTNDVRFILPSSTGSGNNYVLRDDGAGTLSFTNQVPTASFTISSSYAVTASFVRNAQTASYVLNAITASYVLNAVSSSFATTASFIRNAQTASYVLNAINASYAATSSYSTTLGASLFQPANGVLQLLNSPGSILSNILNLYASSSINAQTASFLPVGTYNITSSWATNAISASYALTASYAVNASAGTLQEVTEQGASTIIPITASIISASSFTGSLFGTSSWAIRAVSSSYLNGDIAIVNDLTVNSNVSWNPGNPNTLLGFNYLGNLTPGIPPLSWYVDYGLPGRPVSLRVGESEPSSGGPYSGSHILKDGRELFTNARAIEDGEAFSILGFVEAPPFIYLNEDEDIKYKAYGPGIGNYVPGEVYAGSLTLGTSNFYGVNSGGGSATNIVNKGSFMTKPASPGLLMGQGGFYIFESASMQFNASGALLSPIESASVRFTLAKDSSSLSISVGKNDLREVLFISRSGNFPRIGVGKPTSNASLDISGSVIITGSLTASGDISIRGFSSVSASLASLASGVGTLQQVTDAGNTTTNAISSSFSGVGFFGTASWAINVVNGGGSGGGSDSAFLNQSTAATTWSFAHNLGTQYPVITVYDTNGQVIIPQEIDGEDTNNLKIYFPTSQSGYATAVGGTSALTYYSQSLTTASVNLNTITFTKGDSSQFSITVNTGSGGGGGSSFPYTGSAIISGSLTVTGSTAITGGFEALGIKGSKIQLGTYNVGYDIGAIDTLYNTGAGLIVSGNMPDQNHHNFLKIGNVEMIDVNTLATTNEFLIHNVNTLRVTSGADGGNITTSNQLLKIGGGQFYIYRAGSGDSGGVIQSNGNTTKITDTVLDLFGVSGSYFYIPSANEITTLNGTDYLMGFASDPSSPGLSLTNKIKADKFIWATGSNQIISGGLTVTGSLRASSMTSSLLGTASYAITASYALSSAGGGGGVTINNNTDNYIITATGTANTLNGEANLQYSGSTLINRGRSNFASSGTGVANTTHYFKQTAGDTYAGFLIADSDGEDLIKVEGTLANADAKITIGDTGNAYNTTKVIVDDPNSKIELTSKVYPNSIATQATALSAVGSFDIGSRIADDWSTTGPALTAGRIVYLSGSTQWAQAQANTSGSSYGMLGVVTAAESQREILIEGTIQISGSALSSGVAGQPVYLSAATAGQVTLTPPSTSGQVVRIIGYITKANSNVMYFRPDISYAIVT